MLTTKQAYAVSYVEAIDVMMGDMRRFTVYHKDGRVLEIRYPDGYGVPCNSEQFTETEDAFHIDRQWEEMQVSELPVWYRKCA